MRLNAYDRFLASMNIGYEQWHDGVGYDLDALDRMSPRERESVEAVLVARAESDWRDLEALDRLGTPRAHDAILRARSAHDLQIRLYAHRYGPTASPREWEAAIVDGLAVRDNITTLVSALTAATEFVSPPVVRALWREVRTANNTSAFHCAAALCTIAGRTASVYDNGYRDLCLRMHGPQTPARDAAILELEALCAGTPAEPV